LIQNGLGDVYAKFWTAKQAEIEAAINKQLKTVLT
jgi:hypothetical protein